MALDRSFVEMYVMAIAGTGSANLPFIEAIVR